MFRNWKNLLTFRECELTLGAVDQVFRLKYYDKLKFSHFGIMALV